MGATRSLPTLFGRATAASVEHVHLEKTLQRLRKACAAWARAETHAASAQPKPLLDELKMEMLRHFVAEEANCYFGTIASEMPALLPRIAELRADHTEMLEEAERLRILADDSGRSMELVSGLATLTERFHVHERVESALLREFLLRDDA